MVLDLTNFWVTKIVTLDEHRPMISENAPRKRSEIDLDLVDLRVKIWNSGFLFKSHVNTDMLPHTTSLVLSPQRI